MKKLHIYLDAEKDNNIGEWLRKEAFKRRTSMKSIIMEALVAYRQKK